MFESGKAMKSIVSLAVFLLLTSVVFAQKKKPQGTPVMWEAVNISEQNLYLGPGGKTMEPDLRKVTFIKEEKGGTSKKYRIKDAAGREWVAKIDKESQPETAAVRLLWALGYKTEINYLAPKITIPGKGTFENVRLEARPKDVKRMDRWKWKENPFTETNELRGLKIMMAFLNNWDLKDSNTIILQKGNELHYVISDLGATFGKYGSNNLPIIWRLGRSINKPEDYSQTDFIDGVDEGIVDFAYKGKGSWMFKDITVNQAAWLTNLLKQLNDKQIRDAFRAANYSKSDIDTLTQAVKGRIAELDRVSNGGKLALN